MNFMRDDLRLPDLTFPDVKLGVRETHWNLNRWLYRNGAALRLGDAVEAIRSGRLGGPIVERIELVKKIHAAIRDQLAKGGSQNTAQTQITMTNYLVRWAEEANHPLTLAQIEATYLDWGNVLKHRVTVRKDLKAGTAWGYASHTGNVLDRVLGRQTPLIERTGIKQPRGRRTPQGVRADKQNMESTFAFGHLLQDICDGLPLAVLWGPLPARIALRGGGELEHWSKADPKRWSQLVLEAHSKARTLQTRYPLANLRILAELLMFIGQTGMNLGSAFQLKLRQFSYSTAAEEDSLDVRDYKERRGGEVLFKVFRTYKAHLERYLDWRRSVFPDEELLFPVVRPMAGAERKPPQFNPITQAGKHAGVRFVGPQMLRGARINWLLRESGDPELTADMAQHRVDVLRANYERPSLQRAIREVGRFWQANDPSLARATSLEPTAPGQCDGVPKAVEFKPKKAPSPDCVLPSGCLWCEHHRDVDSLDYVWALVSFRHLKWCEVALYHPPRGATTKHPAQFAIERISEKLIWFRESNAQRQGWVEESLARVEDGHYHPNWVPLVNRFDRGSA